MIHGGLAQLARAPALQAGGQRFESVILHDGIERHSERSLTYWYNQETVENFERQYLSAMADAKIQLKV